MTKSKLVEQMAKDAGISKAGALPYPTGIAAVARIDQKTEKLFMLLWPFQHLFQLSNAKYTLEML